MPRGRGGRPRLSWPVYERPHCTAAFVVVKRPADQRRITAGGQCDTAAEPAFTDLLGTGELFALLSPGRARAHECPCCSDPFLVVKNRSLVYGDAMALEFDALAFQGVLRPVLKTPHRYCVP